ncbi:D-alanyl-D-alanine carboxypeptidase [Actinomadura sp. RB68]|uniref:D-alanyl-D-alanine carboxypeptidase n=1 Tax=Actinomadura macrotermitis TaxID=2585200 RepID=A0A7K0BVQ0_9ACTN|nr:D-alanyl-D-alanine carboxypeptidase [Actinomadura macrotermitis]
MVAAVTGLVAGMGATQPVAARESLFQEQLDRYRSANGAIGAVATVRHGDAVTAYGSGSTQLHPQAKLGADTRLRVGSQTKMFVATIVLQLVDEGKVKLDTPIERYLPGVVRGSGLNPNAITVRQLLQHRSGIKDNLGFVNGDYLQTAQLLLNPRWQLVPPTQQQMVNEGTKYGKQSEPGREGVYSNTNYTILGMLVEKKSGTDLTTAIKKRILKKVGMTSTFYPRPGQKSLPAPYSRGYLSVAGVPFADVTNFEPAVWGAAAALVSTGRDMTKFVNALVSGRVLSPARLADMRRTLPVVRVGDYGLGLAAFPTACGTAWGHTGSVAGYTTRTVSNGSRSISIGMNNTAVIAAPNDAEQRMVDKALCG